MNIESIVVGILGGIGGLIIYKMRLRFDSARAQSERFRAERNDDIKRQYTLLQEFLGKPWSLFIWLMKYEDEKPAKAKREVAREILQWISQNRQHFGDEEIQETFSRIAEATAVLAASSPPKP